MSKYSGQRAAEWTLRYLPKSESVPGLREAGRVILRDARPWVTPHTHDHGRLEICFVEEGRHRDRVNDQAYLLHRGQGFVVRPGDSHGSIHLVQEPSRFSFLVFDVSPARAVFLGLRGASARRLRSALLDIENPLLFSPLAAELWQAVMKAIERMGQSTDDPSCVETVRVYLCALMAALLESSRTHACVQPLTLLERVNQFVDSHPSQRASIAKLAHASHVSESYLHVRVRKETGLSPMNYLLRRRIDMARTRLTESDDPVTRIALDLGFSSSQNFATAFRRISGRTPSRYRFDTKKAGEESRPAT